jgi:dihydrofolate reductase
MDGVIENFNTEMTEDIAAQYAMLDAFIMGRTTFSSLAGYWPTKTTADEPLADHMNSIEKLVCSTTIDASAGANSRVLVGDIRQTIGRLKRESGKDYMIIGSGSIVRCLTESGLIDEFRFLVFPIVLGSGKRIFDGVAERIPLRTQRTRSFNNGVMAIDYATT